MIDTPEEYVGVITEKMSVRRGRMVKMVNHGTGRVRMEVEVPTRGMIGYRSQFLTDTRGAGILTTLVIGHTPHAGNIVSRPNGALVSDRSGRAVTFAIFHLQPRGTIFVQPNDPVYSV